MASAGLSRGIAALTESNTAGGAAEYAKGKGGGGTSEAYRGGAVDIEDRGRLAWARDAINRALHDERQYDPDVAAKIAAKFWGIEAHDVSYNSGYTSGSARTLSYASGVIDIEVGPGGIVDTDWLISTMGHEGVHVDQIRSGNALPGWDDAPNDAVAYQRAIARAVNEVEATDFELARAGSLSLNRAQVGAINEYRGGYLNQLQGTRFYNRVLNGNYSIR